MRLVTVFCPLTTTGAEIGGPEGEWTKVRGGLQTERVVIGRPRQNDIWSGMNDGQLRRWHNGQPENGALPFVPPP